MASLPPARPPLPLAQSFVVCREIFEDCRSHEFVLIGPFSALGAPAFPFTARLSIYAHLSCGHGNYKVTLQLRDTEESSLWEWRCPDPISLLNPLKQQRFTLYDAILEFPEPGRYDLLLLVNGEELARHAIQVHTVAGRQ
jgi:hypothetical protein